MSRRGLFNANYRLSLPHIVSLFPPPLQLPCALKFSAKHALGREPGAHVLEPLHLTSPLFVCLFFLNLFSEATLPRNSGGPLPFSATGTEHPAPPDTQPLGGERDTCTHFFAVSPLILSLSPPIKFRATVHHR